MKLPTSILSLIKTPPLGQKVRVSGWINSIRKQKKIAFVDLTDGSSHIALPVVSTTSQSSNTLSALGTGVAVEIQGKWVPSQGKQEAELLTTPEDITIVGPVTPDYPLQKKFHTNLFLRSIPEYRWKSKTGGSILRFRSWLDYSLADFFKGLEFIKVNPPLSTVADCEGAGELFQMESTESINSTSKEKDSFFGSPTFLSVSAQLHLEVLAHSLSRVWCLNPCFRAEHSDTNRHLSEFWMLEAEIAHITELDQLMDIVEEMLRSVGDRLITDTEMSANILEVNNNEELTEILKERWNMLANTDKYPRITYTEAINIINEHYPLDNPENKAVWGEGLKSEHERWLSGEFFKKAVFVTDYPKEIKPFYMKKTQNNNHFSNKTVACFDLLLPTIGELVGGSLREDSAEILLESMKSSNISVDSMKWYLALRQNGSVPHGGFGMGFERLLCFLSGVENIKDVIPFPRTYKSCVC